MIQTDLNPKKRKLSIIKENLQIFQQEQQKEFFQNKIQKIENENENENENELIKTTEKEKLEIIKMIEKIFKFSFFIFHFLKMIENPLLKLIKENASLEEIEQAITEKNINEYKYSSPIHFACEKKKIDVVKLLLKYGADINLKTNFYPIHLACKSKPSPKIVKILIEAGADINCQSGYTPLHVACGVKTYPKFIKFLIQCGANVNQVSGITPLHLACKFSNSSIAKRVLLENGADVESTNCFYLVLYGADISRQNGWEPKDTRHPEIRKFFDSLFSFSNDFEVFFERKEFTDLEITCQDRKTIPVHKLILKHRLGEENLDQKIKLFQKLKFEEAKNVLKFIYSGKKEFEENEFIKTFFSEIGIEDIEAKSGRKGLIKDYMKLYKDEKTKDFQIKIDEDHKIEVHKIILIARSSLFRGMFLSVQSNENYVQDFSQKSPRAFDQIIQFFYTDSIDSKISDDIYDELLDVEHYFLLNTNSYFVYELERISKDIYFKLGEPEQTNQKEEEKTNQKNKFKI
ncbi:cyclin-dependent kinase inhibitor 2c-related [Anaeramoeba ignava]|uniref:Cyclin-dependent kinase inhibitor 2c-related n=1 Tax=Anaeramoeba ignava TaxID=1746090 RepID=A0A9Q0R5W0_ANAIG|nr:cyclin-dependent kinase inhibitor 2c-related [Anaeramoeba ignava]